jgi:hypothetical protein
MLLLESLKLINPIKIHSNIPIFLFQVSDQISIWNFSSYSGSFQLSKKQMVQESWLIKQ